MAIFAPTEFIPDMITINYNKLNQGQASGIFPTNGNSINLNSLNNITPTLTLLTSGSVGSNLIASTIYYYGVTAIANDGSETTANTSSGINNIINITESSTAFPITISWTTQLNAVSYKIYKATSTSIKLLIEVNSSISSYTDDGTIVTTSATPPSHNISGSLITGGILEVNNSAYFNFNLFLTGVSGFIPLIINAASGTSSIQLQLAGTNYWDIGVSTSGALEIYGANPLYVYNNSTQILELDTSGNLSITGSVNLDLPLNSLAGTTGGKIDWIQPLKGSSYKKVILYFDNYENDTTTSQVITFPTAFTIVNNIIFNNTTLNITITLLGLTILTPDTTTIYNGMITIEGY